MHPDWIKYQCGVCDRVQLQDEHEPFYQCAVCATFLCPDCDNDGVCPTHYAVLKSSDQNMLSVFAEQELKLNSRFGDLYYYIVLIACIPIVCFSATLYALFPHIGEVSHYWPGIAPYFIVGVIFTGIIVVALYYRSQLRVQRATIKITIKGILLQYPELAAIIQERSGLEDKEEPLGNN